MVGVKKTDRHDFLGQVTIREEPNKLPEMSIELKDAPNTQEIPKDYSLIYQQPPSHMSIFSENDDGQIGIEGTVEYRCDMKPFYSEDYRRVCRERLRKSTVKRELKTLGDNSLLAIKPVPARDPSFSKKRKLEDKKERMEKNELVDLLFAIFEKGTYYDIKKHWQHPPVSQLNT